MIGSKRSEVAVETCNEQTRDAKTARAYAELGMADYWVINGKTGLTHVYRECKNGEYHSTIELRSEAQLHGSQIDDLSLCITDLRRA